MRRPFYFLLVVVGLGFGHWWTGRSFNREAFAAVCDLSSRHFYRNDPAFSLWVADCNNKARAVDPELSKSELIVLIQAHMDALGISHFAVYSPQEDKKLWTGESIDTGVRARYVEDRLFIFRVFEGSAGYEAGLRPGDEVLEILGAAQVTPWGVQNRSGVFSVLRNENVLSFEVKAAQFKVQQDPKIEVLSDSAVRLELSSFRSEFFARESWVKIIESLESVDHVVLDLRQNAGGNFVAMLRALSSFVCREKEIGQLLQPRKDRPPRRGFNDDTNDAYQIAELERSGNLALITYPDYGCFAKKVTVLIGPETASTAEIFAEGMMGRPNTRVIGQPTAGDVVLAVWYSLPILGPGYSLSIPEAVFVNTKGEALENKGLAPEQEVYHQVEDARKGLDTFVEVALGRRRK
jgi:carboxyl-terminal processing protease